MWWFQHSFTADIRIIYLYRVSTNYQLPVERKMVVIFFGGVWFSVKHMF